MKMITFAFRNRFSGLVRAILAILAGIALIVWPDKSLDIIVKVIAAAVVASGIFSLILGIIARRAGGLAVPVLNTIVTILVGVLLFGFSGEVTDIILYLVGFIAVLFGLFQGISLISARSFLRLSFLSFLLPVLCFFGGILMLVEPDFVKNAAVIVTGSIFLVYGISELVVSWQMNKAMKEYEIRFSGDGQDEGGSSGKSIRYEDVKDAEFEKVEEE